MGSAQQNDKPYKPKFHKAVLYNEQQQQAQSRPPSQPVSEDEARLSMAEAFHEASLIAAVDSARLNQWNRERVELQFSNPPSTQYLHGHPYPSPASATSPMVTMSDASRQSAHPSSSSSTSSSHIPPRLSHLVSSRRSLSIFPPNF